ncbi:hypothetical protein DL98DRAFT_104787 [Cadophora sp. DSE1049]|nr:hypothetical protein DL98DRAFT_104787 [Cadophora sp. DSE1049]
MPSDVETPFIDLSSLLETGLETQTISTASATAFLDFVTADLDPRTTENVESLLSSVLSSVLISTTEASATISTSSTVLVSQTSFLKSASSKQASIRPASLPLPSSTLLTLNISAATSLLPAHPQAQPSHLVQ